MWMKWKAWLPEIAAAVWNDKRGEKMTEFVGFSKKTLSFFRNLKKNNTREWFLNHRADYDNFVLEPAKAFIVAMGERLKTIVPEITYEPKANRSLFRINRDTRFSPDKSPYKTNAAILFWEGTRKRMECASFYVHIAPSEFYLGGGIYVFPPDMLETYRRAVVHPQNGQELARVVKKITSSGDVTLGGQHYKRVPRGYDPQHPNVDLLLHNGLYASDGDKKIPEEFYTADLVEYCFRRFKPMLPLHKWLVKVLG